MLVVVLVLENPDRFAIRLTEQISSIGLFAVTESQCTEEICRTAISNSEFWVKSEIAANTGSRAAPIISQGVAQRWRSGQVLSR